MHWGMNWQSIPPRSRFQLQSSYWNQSLFFCLMALSAARYGFDGDFSQLINYGVILGAMILPILLALPIIRAAQKGYPDDFGEWDSNTGVGEQPEDMPVKSARRHAKFNLGMLAFAALIFLVQAFLAMFLPGGSHLETTFFVVVSAVVLNLIGWRLGLVRRYLHEKL